MDDKLKLSYDSLFAAAKAEIDRFFITLKDDPNSYEYNCMCTELDILRNNIEAENDRWESFDPKKIPPVQPGYMLLLNCVTWKGPLSFSVVDNEWVTNSYWVEVYDWVKGDRLKVLCNLYKKHFEFADYKLVKLHI